MLLDHTIQKQMKQELQAKIIAQHDATEKGMMQYHHDQMELIN